LFIGDQANTSEQSVGQEQLSISEGTNTGAEADNFDASFSDSLITHLLENGAVAGALENIEEEQMFINAPLHHESTNSSRPNSLQMGNGTRIHATVSTLYSPEGNPVFRSGACHVTTPDGSSSYSFAQFLSSHSPAASTHLPTYGEWSKQPHTAPVVYLPPPEGEWSHSPTESTAPTYHLLQPVAGTSAAFASSQSPHSPTESTAPTYHLLQPVAGTSASSQIARCSPISSTSNPSQSTEPGPNSNAEVLTATATASENERSPIANPSQGALSSRGRGRGRGRGSSGRGTDPPKKRGRPPKPKNVPVAPITKLPTAGVSDQFADAVTDDAEVNTDDETDPVSLPPPTKRRRGRPRKSPQPTAVLTAPHSDTDEQIENDDEDMDDDDGQSIALSDLRFPLAKRRAGRPAGPKPCYLYKYTTSQKPFEKKPKEEQTMSMCLHYF